MRSPPLGDDIVGNTQVQEHVCRRALHARADDLKGGCRLLRGVVFEGLKVYQDFVLSSNGGRQSIRAILRLYKLGHI